METNSINKMISLGVIILITILLYIPSLKNDLLWDDQSLIVGNDKIHHLSQIPKLFFTDFFDFERIDGPDSGGYYRPLPVVSFGLDWLVWQGNPIGFHLSNLFIHILNVIMGFWLILRLIKSPQIAFLATLLFAIHPLQVDSVAYVSGRTDLLAVTFIFASFICALLSEERNQKSLFLWITSLLCFVGALLSKEIGILLPPLLFVYFWQIKKKAFFESLIRLIPYGLITLGYFILRSQILNIAPAEQVSYFSDAHWRVLCTLIAWLKSSLLFFYPTPIYFERFQPYVTEWTPQMLLGILGFLFYSGLTVWLFFKEKSLFFFSALYGLALLPVIGLHPLFIQDSIFWTEHFFYLPSLGLFVILLTLLDKKIHWTQWKKPISISLCSCLVLFFSFFTVDRIQDWKNEETLFGKALQYNPNSARAHNNLALFYQDNRNDEKAIHHLKIAMEINPNSPGAYNNLGNIYKDQKNWKEAEAYYKKAIEVGSNTSGIFYNLADLYMQQNKQDKAEVVFQWGLKRVKDPHTLYNHLGMLYIRQNKEITALIMFQKAIELRSDFTLALNNLGILLAKRDQFEKAEKLFRKALFWNSDQAETHSNLGNLYLIWNKPAQAKKQYNQALQLFPESTDAQKGLQALQKLETTGSLF